MAESTIPMVEYFDPFANGKHLVARKPIGLPMTVGELRAALARVADDAWVCVSDGPLNEVVYEYSANEPFLLLAPTVKYRTGLE